MIRLAYLAFHSRGGGAEVCLLSLLDGLDRTRFTPLVVLSGPGPLADDLRAREIPIVFEPRMRYLVRGASSPLDVGVNIAAFVGAERSLRRLVAEHRIDLVHAFVTPALKYGGIVARRTGIAAVASMHDLLIPPFSWVRRRVIAANINLLYDRLVVPSLVSRAAALAAGVDPAKLALVPNGVDTRRFAGDPEERARTRAALGFAPDTPVVGMVGRFVPLKGHDVLLHALDGVRQRRDDVRCLIVGDAVFEGEQAWKARVTTLARELDLESRIVFTGWRRDIPALLSAMDVFVQPATEGDSFPTTILEAMAVGVAVVAARDGSAREMVEDGTTGVLVPPRDAPALAATIVRLLDDPILSAQMGRAARAKIESEFSRERYCRATEAIYDAVLGAGR